MNDIFTISFDLPPKLLFKVGDVILVGEEKEPYRVEAIGVRSLKVSPIMRHCRLTNVEVGDSGDSAKVVDSSKSLQHNDVSPVGE